jgi:deazaflavin-dependent oxidoreductase (nitroreductase family)
VLPIELELIVWPPWPAVKRSPACPPPSGRDLPSLVLRPSARALALPFCAMLLRCRIHTETLGMPQPHGSAPPVAWWQRLIQRAGASRPVSAALAPILHLVDAPILRLSSGRHSLTQWLLGFPVMMVTTVGAKTGRLRPKPLAALQDGEHIVLVASSYGRRHHPGWYYNLRHHPYAWVGVGALKRLYRAREAMGEERDSYWVRATQAYLGFAAYARRATGRTIPVVVLSPERDEAGRP